ALGVDPSADRQRHFRATRFPELVREAPAATSSSPRRGGASAETSERTPSGLRKDNSIDEGGNDAVDNGRPRTGLRLEPCYRTWRSPRHRVQLHPDDVPRQKRDPLHH